MKYFLILLLKKVKYYFSSFVTRHSSLIVPRETIYLLFYFLNFAKVWKLCKSVATPSWPPET